MSLNEASASQQTIWDFNIDAVAGLTNVAGLPTISSDKIEPSH